MADGSMYKVKYKGKLIRVEVNDLSNQRLREMKARFGQAYGSPDGLIALLATGDMDAIGCMIWVGQQKPSWKGGVEDLMEMDFSLGDLEFVSEEPEEKPKEKRPTKRGASTSDQTSENSETSTSSTSETSSD